jgi:hypothetical protein
LHFITTIDLFSFSYLVESKFKRHFPDVDVEILELIPYTHGQHLLGCRWMVDLIKYPVGWSDRRARSSRSFWIPDINTMLRKLAKYQHNVHLRRPGAQQALEDFKAQQIRTVTSIREVGSILPWWNYTETQYSAYARENSGGTILFWGAIMINGLSFASGSSRKMFIVYEKIVH